jgi:hypothetical protein
MAQAVKPRRRDSGEQIALRPHISILSKERILRASKGNVIREYRSRPCSAERHDKVWAEPFMPFRRHDDDWAPLNAFRHHEPGRVIADQHGPWTRRKVDRHSSANLRPAPARGVIVSRRASSARHTMTRATAPVLWGTGWGYVPTSLSAERLGTARCPLTYLASSVAITHGGSCSASLRRNVYGASTTEVPAKSHTEG